jgi:lipid-binding SYLF domain-containing protein
MLTSESRADHRVDLKANALPSGRLTRIRFAALDKRLWQLRCTSTIATDTNGAKNRLRRNSMKNLIICAMSMLLGTLAILSASAWADNQQKDEDRLRNSGTVLKEILDVPDDIPQDLLDKADCVVVFPSVLKAAFIVGGSYGRGAMTCRQGQDFGGRWGAPTMMALEGGSFGFQIGGQATDFVLLVMNERGANGILSSKVKLGADAAVAAGPVGRDASAETDATLRAEILSYSRSRGVFAGVSLEGSTIRPDEGANQQIYGEKIPAKQIALSGNRAIPQAAQGLISTLDSKTPRHKA